MIDKYIKLTTSGGADVSKNIEGQIQQPQKVSGGVEGSKKEQGLKMKKGGFIAKGCGKVMSNRRKKTRMY